MIVRTKTMILSVFNTKTVTPNIHPAIIFASFYCNSLVPVCSSHYERDWLHPGRVTSPSQHQIVIYFTKYGCTEPCCLRSADSHSLTAPCMHGLCQVGGEITYHHILAIWSYPYIETQTHTSETHCSVSAHICYQVAHIVTEVGFDLQQQTHPN